MSLIPWTEHLPIPLVHRIVDARLRDPERIAGAAKARKRRPPVMGDNRICLLSIERPFRPDRVSLLNRAIRALSNDWIDGLLGPVDLIEDLFLLNDFLREDGAGGCVDHKVLIVSFPHPHLPEVLRDYRVDGIALDARPASLEAAAAFHDIGLPIIVSLSNTPPEAELDRLLSSLPSTRNLWISTPHQESLSQFVCSTLCPLLIDGARGQDSSSFLRGLQASLPIGHQVRGALIPSSVWAGENIDPSVMAGVAGRMVHEGIAVKQALEGAARDREAPVAV